MQPDNPIYFCNRAIANIKLESFGGALADANKAIELDPKFIKAYYRRGIALMSLQRFSEAVKDLKKVCFSINIINVTHSCIIVGLWCLSQRY